MVTAEGGTPNEDNDEMHPFGCWRPNPSGQEGKHKLSCCSGIIHAPRTMNKTYRYALVVVGCIAQAVIARVIYDVLVSSDDRQPHIALKQIAVLGLLLTWPAWGIALWYCGWRRAVSVVIPMVIGLVILRPLGEGLVFVLGIAAGGHT